MEGLDHRRRGVRTRTREVPARSFDVDVVDRSDVERQNLRDQQAAHDGDTQGLAQLGAGTGAEIVHEEYAPVATSDFTAPGERLFNALKDRKGRKVIFIIWAGGNPFKIADMDLKRFGIEIATGGNILPAMVAYKQFPGMEGAAYYYFGIPKNPVNEALVSMHYSQYKSPPDFFTAGGFSAAMALVTALKKTQGDTSSAKLIQAMEGMSFDTHKGKMTFRKEDHQAMQSMYHFRIKIDPAFNWGVPELIREIKPEEMNVPIRNQR